MRQRSRLPRVSKLSMEALFTKGSRRLHKNIVDSPRNDGNTKLLAGDIIREQDESSAFAFV